MPSPPTALPRRDPLRATTDTPVHHQSRLSAHHKAAAARSSPQRWPFWLPYPPRSGCPVVLSGCVALASPPTSYLFLLPTALNQAVAESCASTLFVHGLVHRAAAVNVRIEHKVHAG